MQKFANRIYTVYMVYSAVVLIWQFGVSCKYCQIKYAISIQYSNLPIIILPIALLEQIAKYSRLTVVQVIFGMYICNTLISQ